MLGRRTSTRVALLCSTTLLTLALGTSVAHANGRYPESNQLIFAAHDPELVILRVTFGLLISHDRGKTFQWVCEQSVGYSGVEDPMYAVTPTNAVIATTFQGVSVTRENACNWSFVGGDLSEGVFIDLSANPTDAKNVFVFASGYDKQDDAGQLHFLSKIWETKDEGLTFQPIGAPLDSSLLGYTIDLAKSDPNRIYVSVVRNPGPQPQGILLTSTNRGQSWVEEPVPLLADERTFYIAAVDPSNAERVYLRTYAASPEKPTRLILREADGKGGAPTQRTIFTAVGGLPGFALTPDGSKVYVGGLKDGVQVANTSDFVFTKRSALEVQCLGLNDEGLWACSNELMGFIAGISKDDGVTFEPKLRFCGIEGTLSNCGPGSTTTDICGARWPSQQELLGCAVDRGSIADGGGSSPDGSTNKNIAPKSGGGCDCQASPVTPWGTIASALGAAGALLMRARRTKSRRSVSEVTRRSRD